MHYLLAVEGARAVEAKCPERDQPRLECAARGAGLVLAAVGERGQQVVVDQIPHPHPQRQANEDRKECARAPREAQRWRTEVAPLRPPTRYGPKLATRRSRR